MCHSKPIVVREKLAALSFYSMALGTEFTSSDMSAGVSACGVTSTAPAWSVRDNNDQILNT